MSDRLDLGDKNDETSTDVNVSFSCADCGQQFNSRQELKEHESTQHHRSLLVTWAKKSTL